MVRHPTGRPSNPPSADGGPSVATMVESVLGCKWSMRLLDLIADGCHRPSAMLKACDGLSAKVLNERLRKLVRLGIVNRTVHGDKPPIRVEYKLTEFGRRFTAVIDEVRKLQQALDNGTLDAGGENM